MADTGMRVSGVPGDENRKPPLPPLDMGKVLLGSFNVYRRYFAPLAVMFVLLYLPMLLFTARFGYMMSQMQRAAEAGRSPLPGEYELTLMGVWGLGLLVWFLLAFPFLLIVPARLAGLSYLDLEVSFGDCVRYAWRHWWDTQASYALFGIILIGIFVIPLLTAFLGYIPGMEIAAVVLAASVLLLVSIAAIVLVFMVAPMNGAIAFDRPQGNLYHRARANLAHTFRLSRRHFWYLVGTLIVAWLLMGLFRFMVTRPVEIIAGIYGIWQEHGAINLETLFFAPPPWVATMQLTLSSLVGVLALPFEQGVTGLLYFDLRGKDEGVDLLVNSARMAEEEDILAVVGEAAQPEAAGGGGGE